MQRHRHVSPRRFGLALAVAVTLLSPVRSPAEAADAWGEVSLPGGAAAARLAMGLGDPAGRLESTVLVDFIRRYANTDLRTASDRFERYLLDLQAPDGSPLAALASSTLPLPLPGFWQDSATSQRTLPIVSLLRSRPALLTYHGLMALDTPTLQDLSARPTLVRSLLDNSTASAAFAAFAGSLRVRERVVVTPGDGQDAAVWQQLVGADPADVDAFVRALYERDGGRLAWFYDTVSGLPAAAQQFVLLANTQAPDRAAAVQAIYRRFIAVEPAWRIDVRPFYRPPFDAALALLVLDVGDDGRLGPDWWPALFDQVTHQDDWSMSAPAIDRAAARPADARWFFDWVFATPEVASARFGVLRFAQRVFASVPLDAAAPMHAALGGVLDMPSLLLTVERMGVDEPEVLAALARTAYRLTHTGSENRAIPLLARWQAAVGLLEQVQRHRHLPPATVARLLQSLVDATPSGADSGQGFVAAWLADALLPAVLAPGPAPLARIEPTPLLEDTFLQLATTPRDRTPKHFVWEGLPYAVSAADAAGTSARAIRRSRPGPQVQDLIELDRIRRTLQTPSSPIAVTRTVAARLEALAPAVAWLEERDPRVVRDFQRVAAEVGPGSEPRREQLPAIAATVDAMTDAVVPSLLYALAVSPTTEPILYPEAWTRHSLASPTGAAFANGRPWRQVAWQFPTDYGFGGGTRLIGSFLGVDLALVDAQLVRLVSSSLPVPGVVDDPMRRGLIESLVLEPRDDDPDLSRLLAALAEGRRVVDTWSEAPPDTEILTGALRQASVDPWRANAIAWDVSKHHLEGLRNLSVTELVWIGSAAPSVSTASVGWSASSRLLDGCRCRLESRRVTGEQMRGRRLGVQALRPLDITIRLAELLAALDLDVTAAPAMMPMALQDWLDRSRPAWSDDWEAFTFWPHGLTLERVEAYLLHLVSNGTLSPPATEESP